ncbi:MAG: TIGR02391 family protein [Thermomicrobiales bacterium]
MAHLFGGVDLRENAVESTIGQSENEPAAESTDESEEDPVFWFLSDLELRRELDRLSSNDFAGHVRTAFVHLERRIRQTAGLDEHDFGTDLIDKAFRPDSGALQPVSPMNAECAGLHNLLKGIFLYYRNPVAHRPISYDPDSAQRVLVLIDHALHLVTEAANAAFNIDDFVGPQEGRILHRHDFRLDIDGDGENEIVAVIGFGPVTDAGVLKRKVSAIILKKAGDSYKRIPAESIEVPVPHEIGFVDVKRITNVEKPDLVMYWFRNEVSGFMTVLREIGGKYIVVRREIDRQKEVLFENPSDCSFAIELHRIRPQWADVDGDGLSEISHTIQVTPEQLPAFGFPGFMTKAGEAYDVCRVMKWNEAKDSLEQVDERLVVGLWRPETG